MKKIILLMLLFGLCGCISAQIELDPKWNPQAKASYEDYFDSYFLGFVGEPSVNLQKVCMDQHPYGVRRVKTAEDGLLTFVTLGIYSPTTVRVWCGD